VRTGWTESSFTTSALWGAEDHMILLHAHHFDFAALLECFTLLHSTLVSLVFDRFTSRGSAPPDAHIWVETSCISLPFLISYKKKTSHTSLHIIPYHHIISPFHPRFPRSRRFLSRVPSYSPVTKKQITPYPKVQNHNKPHLLVRSPSSDLIPTPYHA
jgi:hypothetical protein